MTLDDRMSDDTSNKVFQMVDVPYRHGEMCAETVESVISSKFQNKVHPSKPNGLEHE